MKKSIVINEDLIPRRQKNKDSSLDARGPKGLFVLQGKPIAKDRQPREENSQSSMVRRMRLEPLSYHDFSSTIGNQAMLSNSKPEAYLPFTPPISSQYNPLSLKPAHSKSLSKKRKAITQALNE